MNHRQTRLLEDFVDGPRARHMRRQRAQERREFLSDALVALFVLALAIILVWVIVPAFVQQ